jgi:integrase
MNVGEYLEKKWLPGIKGTVSDRAYGTYVYHVKRLKPLVGNLALYNLSGMDLQEALPKGCFGNVKPKTVKGFYGTLKTALKQAVAWGLLSVDPTTGLRTPRVPKEKREVLTALELVRLLDAAKRYKYYLVIRLLALTGARLGEILGLKWTDVDFKKGTLTIQRSADSRNRVLKDDTKTEASPRTIRLDDDSLALLTAFKDERRVAGPKVTSLIFNYEGRVVREDAIRRTMNYALKRAGLAHKRIHDLRHGAGSLLLDGGESLAAVSAFLGHSSTATTAAVYAHAVREGTSIPGLLPQSDQMSDQ